MEQAGAAICFAVILPPPCWSNKGAYAIADLEIMDPYRIPLLQGVKDTFVSFPLKAGQHA